MLNVENALVRRINRRLQGSTVRRCPYSSRWFNELGRCYLVDPFNNVILEKDIDLQEFSKRVGIPPAD